MTAQSMPGSTNVISARCEVCDATFDGVAQDAFDQGWDVPPWFTGYIKCPDCPITDTAFYIMYAGWKHEA